MSTPLAKRRILAKKGRFNGINILNRIKNQPLKLKKSCNIETSEYVKYERMLEERMNLPYKDQKKSKVSFTANTLDFNCHGYDIELFDKMLFNKINLLKTSTPDTNFKTSFDILLSSVVRFYLRELFHDVLTEGDDMAVYNFHKSLKGRRTYYYRHADAGAAVHYALNQYYVNENDTNALLFINAITSKFLEKKDETKEFIKNRIILLVEEIKKLELSQEYHLLPLASMLGS